MKQPQRNPLGGIIPQSNVPGANKSIPSYSFKEGYPAGVEQQAEDYDTIMGGYRNILDEFGGGKDPYAELKAKYGNLSKITPESYNYTRSPEVTESFGKLRNLAETGGYEAGELADLRARGISPIRATYANAMRNVNRQRSLSGGYSPNYNATMSRMTRDLSEQVAGATTNVNAAIAERVAAGRQAAIPQFAQYTGAENELANKYGAGNVEARNRAAEINAQRELESLNAQRGLEDLSSGRKLSALSGMQSLYGTTPALVNTFGNQAAQAAQLQESAKGRTAATGSNLVGSYINTLRNRPQIAQPTAQPGSVNLIQPPNRNRLRSPYSGKMYGS